MISGNRMHMVMAEYTYVISLSLSVSFPLSAPLLNLSPDACSHPIMDCIFRATQRQVKAHRTFICYTQACDFNQCCSNNKTPKNLLLSYFWAFRTQLNAILNTKIHSRKKTWTGKTGKKWFF